MKKLFVALLIGLFFITVTANATPTVVRDGNHIYIYGDTVANDGDFDVYAALGYTVGTDELIIDHWCWYGSTIEVGDIAELETADNKTIGPQLYAVIAKGTMCTHSLNKKVDRIYVDQLSHGTIVIILKRKH